MRNRNAFTLIELLVVIAIVALLMSILIPSLRKAREQASSVYCRSLLKSFGLANEIYANENDEWFVPIMDDTKYLGGWFINQAFIRYLAMIDKNPYGKDIQETYICPSASEETRSLGWPFNRNTLAPNITGMVRRDGKYPAGGPGTGFMGIKRSALRSASEKLMYIDATGNHLVTLGSANYEEVWDS